MPLLTSPPIGQAFSADALQRRLGTLHIVNAERGAVVVAEVELADVADQVLLAALVIGADQSALEDREVAFDGVGVCRAASVFAGVVAHGLMGGELAADLDVLAGLVGAKVGVFGDVVDQHFADRAGLNVGDM